MLDLVNFIYSFLGVIAITLLYQVTAGAIYRLYYSPISHIPGPKLAALTLWYIISLFFSSSPYSSEYYV